MEENNNKLLNIDILNMLSNGGVSNCIQEAKWIVEYFPNYKDAMNAAKARLKGKPLQYILGEWEFYGIPIYVGRGVFIPRQDTEALVDYVLSHAHSDFSYSSSNYCGLSVIDLCTGSGAIAFALERHLPKAEIFAVEISPKAIKYFEKNSERLKSKVKLFKGDVLKPNFENFNEKFDIIVANPPYLNSENMNSLQRELNYEPALALAGSNNIDGLKYYRKIAQKWKPFLKTDGLLAFEIGNYQASEVEAIFKDGGYKEINILKDLNENDRVALAFKK